MPAVGLFGFTSKKTGGAEVSNSIHKRLDPCAIRQTHSRGEASTIADVSKTFVKGYPTVQCRAGGGGVGGGWGGGWVGRDPGRGHLRFRESDTARRALQDSWK